MNKKISILIILVLLVLGIFYFFGKKEMNITKKTDIKNEIAKIEKEKNMNEETQKNEIITTASGLQYEVIRMGDGPKPKATDTVEVHYEGKLENGEIFDSSYQRGQKISFPLNQVIAGWTEGLQLMPVGSKFKFIIPPELAYGPAGSGHPLSGKTLIFTVELFAIK